jgi:exosortase/archaeosortase family protein
MPVVLDLAIAIGVCVLGYRYGAGLLQAAEARWVVSVLRWTGVEDVSAAVPRHILVLSPDREPILAEVTASCSAALSVLGLTALALTVLRRRRQHAVAGLVVASAALLALNHLRLLGSAAAGLWWGTGALVLFHDWIGTIWNLAATLLGFLLMVWVTLPTQERAEQDVDGRHTARRPVTWARPGLGYRAEDADLGVRRRAVTLTGLLHRYVFPRRFSRWLAARREAARIDYRIGHLAAEEQVRRVTALASDGLGAHVASLLAVATYEKDPVVLDGLAAAVAARQWEPVTGPDVAALRLWARGWALARGAPAGSHPADDEPVVPAVPRPGPPVGAQASVPEGPRPRTFARPPLPVPTSVHRLAEELR